MHPDHDFLKRRLGTLKHIIRLSWILMLICIVLVTLSLYFFSPYWATRQILSALQTQDIVQLKQRIPKKLLTHLITNTHPDVHWKSAGGQYLKHVWPKLYQEIDREVWLSLHVQGLREDEIRHYYQHYFNQYALDLGSQHEQIRIEFERTNILRWHVTRVCYPNPQPDWVENRCPSSKR
jgi:hypothetical protein